MWMFMCVCSGEISAQFEIFSAFTEYLILIPGIFPDGKSLVGRPGVVARLPCCMVQGHAISLFQSKGLHGFCAQSQTVSVLGIYSLSKRSLKKTKFNMLKSSIKPNCFFLLWPSWLLLQAPFSGMLCYTGFYTIMENN